MSLIYLSALGNLFYQINNKLSCEAVPIEGVPIFIPTKAPEPIMDDSLKYEKSVLELVLERPV
jgi:hypothetical protein